MPDENILTLIYKFADEFDVDIDLSSNIGIMNPGVKVKMSDDVFYILRIISSTELENVSNPRVALHNLLHQMYKELLSEHMRIAQAKLKEKSPNEI